jgi:hypothetical protein
MTDNKPQQTAQEIVIAVATVLSELVCFIPPVYFTWELSAAALANEFDFFRAKLHRSVLFFFLGWLGMRDANNAQFFTLSVSVTLYLFLRRSFDAVMVQSDEYDGLWNRLADRRFTVVACSIIVLADLVLFFKGLLNKPNERLWSDATQASQQSSFSVLIVCILHLGMVIGIPYLVVCFRHRKRS